MALFRKKKNKHKDSGRHERSAKRGPASEAPERSAPPPSAEPTQAPPVPEPAQDTPVPEPAPPSPDAPVAPPPAARAEPVEAAAEPTAAAPQRRGWRRRLSASGFARGLSGLFARHPRLDDALLDELETVLVTADLGVNASMELVEDLRTRMHKREFADADALVAALRQALVTQLADVEQALDVTTAQPFVLLVVGVNGVGKTTTIGKLARRYRENGRNVLLAAGDTFRAAAVEQLKAWGARNEVAVVAQGTGADAASVIYDAFDAARARHTDLLIADTAGRLHTQGGLMDELTKVIRVMKKLDADAPHEVLMVIDATTGQNAINQVRQFRDAAGVTGLVVTKLDGTAKGGVVFALAREFALPIRFVGLGEGIDDLQVFDPAAFVDGLLPAQVGTAAE